MIDVLMATYRPNGEWLDRQIESIRSQTGVDVNLIRREDERGEGPCANFAALLQMSQAQYTAFSDQDDVWDNDKLERSMSLMRTLETRYGKDSPLLVFTDATITDSELNILSPSLFKWTHIDPDRRLVRELVFQNVANGNTILINAALRRLATPIPEEAFMHDHWLMLVAASFGHIACLAESTLRYRQHGGNAIGGSKVGAAYFLNRALSGPRKLRARLYANVRQAEAFAMRYGEKSPRAIRALVGFRSRHWPIRVGIILRHRLFKFGFLRNLGTFLIA